ncbi:bromodomain adjacent to zinc finger domain protein 1A-like isoform X2 [Periplaneta americana]|uniref:bromodomain adjacent to zinc finger domain protein 1A-like isoform X2 n=1 Tax=Periplaneta americana TaxID=6978 RepID=UPI0037E8103C
MPLLRRKPFVKKKLPEDLDEEEEVFYCELTNEVFRDYEEFCQRVILCNSLVWSCSLTGRPQLTYQEALQSEENARAIIKTFPKKLVVPVLYLASLAQKSSFGDLADYVFTFVRDRYFIGETIEVNINDDTWCDGCILQVTSPTEREINKYLSGNSDSETSFPPATLYSYKVRKLDKSEEGLVVTAKASHIRRTKGVYTREKNRLILKQFTEQKHKVWVVKDKISQKYKIPEIKFGHIFCDNLPGLEITKKVAKMTVTSQKTEVISPNNLVKKEKRQETIQKYFKSPAKTEVARKRSLSPDKHKVSGKDTSSPGKKEKSVRKQPDVQAGKQDTKKGTSINKKDIPKKSVGIVKQENSGKKLSAPQQKQEKSPKKKLTAGTAANSQKSPTKTPKKCNTDSVVKTPQKQQQLAKKVKEKYKDAGNQKKKDATKNLLEKHKMNKTSLTQGINDRLTVEERRKKLKEERKERAQEERRKKVEEKLKEKAKLKEEKLRLAEFLKQWNRQREDLECEDLKALPVPTKVDCAIPNEYFGDFIMVLEFLHSFGDILSARAFFPGGVTFEIVERALSISEVAGPLSDIIQLLLSALFNMQEEEDDEILETDNQTTVGLVDEVGDITTSEAIRLATAAAGWCQLYQGMSLNKVTLDSVTLTEVLRLHLLSSGGRSGEMSSKWRYQQRGGYTSLDDPGLLLRIQEPHILRSLSVMNVCDLPLGDKLKIVTCLINQILTYATVRDVIDERWEKLKQLRGEIKVHQVAELKKEREAAALRLKKRKEAKLKLKEGDAPVTAVTTAMPSVDTPIVPTAEEEEAGEIRRQRLDRESSRRKQEIQKKSRELYQAVFGHQVLPLGSDRAYRRFWVFSSLPGLFVEHDERWAGSCLSVPTPYNPTLSRSEDTLTYVRKLFEEEWNGGSGSDKENDIGDEARPVATSSSNKKLLTEKNTSGDSGAVANMNNSRIVSDRTGWTSSDKMDESEKVTVTKEELLICTADINTCPVHGHSSSLQRTKWAFFSKEEELNLLIECLNRRGIRESELRQTLIQERTHIVQNMSNCPVHKLDPTQIHDVCVPEPRKSSRSQKHEDANLNFPPGTPIDEILEVTLRDFILEMEEKMQLGGLGSLKVYSREAWRTTIYAKSYDKQCDKLVWGIHDHVKNEEKSMKEENVKKEENNMDDESNTKKENITENGDITNEYDDDKKEVIVKKDENERDSSDIPMEVDEKERSRSPNITDTEIGYRDPGRLLLEDGEQSSQQNPVVHNLASAILQIAQSVEKKYLQKPLGAEDGSNDNTLMKRWEVSLMASTSFSQLFLHFSTLDNSIQWSRSALNAHCRLCRRRGDAENMLLCDGCNKGHHLYCLKPKLTKVPQGDWFCPKCRPPEKVRASRKTRRLFSQESDEDDVQKDKTQDSQNPESEIVEVCNACGLGGHVICCDACPLLYHTECVVPPLKKVPRGKWFCPQCKVVKDGVSEVTRELAFKLRRCSATAAVAKISVFAKRLRSNSWDDTSSVQSDSELQPTRRSGRRSLEVDLDLPLNNAVLQDLLTDVMHHKDSWPFLRPVPRAQVPDYHLIIKRPMDFGKMKYKLNMLEYRNNSEFIADALLVFENCQMYNQVDAQEYKAGVRLGRYFEKRCRELGLQLKEEELRPPEAKKARLN